METVKVIGLGSGRCGTKSLAALLNAQENAKVTHEARPLLPWEVDQDRFNVREDGWNQELYENDLDMVGDVGFYYLPYVSYAMNRHNLKCICLMREETATVASFERWSHGQNFWHVGGNNPEWEPCFPKYNMPLERSARKWYREYYIEAAALQRKYPRRFLIVPTFALNSTAGQLMIGEFLGIDPHRFNHQFKILNKG